MDAGRCNDLVKADTWQTSRTADLSIVQLALETNSLAPWDSAKLYCRYLKKASTDGIVNVSSGAGSLSSMTGSIPAYRLLKVALNAITRMLAMELKSTRILVNAVCPGWVATDMGGVGGRPVEEGAKSVIWAALLPRKSPTGVFFRDGKSLTW